MIEESGTGPALAALHCNLNVRDVGTAASLYTEGLGLVVKMKSEAIGQDASSLGIAGKTDSEAWFLYDHRGGRAGPAVELVEWRKPRTSGEVSSHPSATGLAGLGFAVPSVEETVERLVTVGGVLTQSRYWYDNQFLVEAIVQDADGVAIELHGEAGLDGATFRYARLNCADLERTRSWYEAIGFGRIGEAYAARWEGGRTDPGPPVMVQRVRIGQAHSWELHLTSWTPNEDVALDRKGANHRGLFRIALAVDDVRAAVEGARTDPEIDLTDPTFIPLPGTSIDGFWVSMLNDPNGVMVEFVERPAAQNSKVGDRRDKGGVHGRA